MKKTENGNLRLVDPPGVAGANEPDRSGANRASSSGTGQSNASNGGDFNLRVLLQAPAKYVREKFGEQTLRSVANAAGLTQADLDGKSNWGSLEQVEAFLAGVRELTEDEEGFKLACVYRYKESLGPLRFVMRASSPNAVYKQGIKNFKVVSRISSHKIAEEDENRIRLVYRSDKLESASLCSLRKEQAVALSTIWGLPPATLTEYKCIASGDEVCEYELRWYQHRRWLPILSGLLVGVAGAAGLWTIGLATIPLWAALPLIGCLAGYAFEQRRTNRANLAIGEEMNQALRELARDDAESRREVLASHKRQRQWSHMMEEQVAERTSTIENLLGQAQNLHAERRSVIQGFSHDLRSPFQVVSLSNQMLLKDRGSHSIRTLEILEDQSEALAKMKLMLEDLVKVASKETGLIRLSPQRLEVEPLVDQLRRRLRAFVHGRDIRVSVFSTREAPDVIETDRLLFDRVIDNLLTNAAKYTERGSIVVELDGQPEFLTIKVSDTGRGIAASDIERIFREGGSDPSRRKAGSYGVGLSVVVQLLGQIGGRLEVKSMPDKGTTFWAHFPVAIRKEEKPGEAPPRRPKPTPEELVVQVVKIRKSQPP